MTQILARVPTRPSRTVRAGILLALVMAGSAAGVAWGWSSPLPADRTFHIRARQFAYEPGILQVNRGDRVVLHVESADVTHGIAVDGYGVRGKVLPGRDLRLTFVANRPGRFAIRCSETCGVFHPFMTGQLVVEPNLLLPGSIGLAAGAAVAAVLYAGWTSGRRRP